jgi:UDP-glucuronate decarboxylase
MPKRAIFDKKNILVTGGAGFIGSHLCDDLVKESKVICIDNFISGDEKNIDHLLRNPDFAFIKHDMTKPIDLEKRPELEKFQIKFQGVQEIYHLACPTSPKYFQNRIVDTVLANSLGVKNALDLAVKYKAKFMYFSSSVVYGPRRTDLKRFDEEYYGYVNPVAPRACYDEGKRFAETLVSTYRTAHNLDAKIARIFRTYGSRMKFNEGHMIPDFVFNALENKDLIVYGDESFSTSLCHVSDIISGIKKFMQSGEVGPINFGSELEQKIVDVANLVIKMTDSKSKIIYQDWLMFMSPLGIPDIALAKEKIGWFPVVRLEDGIKEVIDYVKAHKSLVRPEIASDIL